MSKIGVYGGTFDPIHNGHLITIQTVLEKRNLDEIIFIPCYISPHKTDIYSSPSDDRLEMLKLALDGQNGFSCSDYEIHRKEISYTLNTIQEFRKTHDKIELIIGFDNLLCFDDWYKPDTILDLCDVVVMKRNIDVLPEEENKYFNLVHFIETPLIEISSTTIRERVKSGLSISYYVPNKVEKYIHEKKLYL